MALGDGSGFIARTVVDDYHLERGLELLLAQRDERPIQGRRGISRRDDHAECGLSSHYTGY